MADKIKLVFLGTGSAIPTARRNHSAIYLSYKGENFLIDCGEGTQVQFRRAKLNLMKLNKIFITHWHGDHILGLPGLLQTMSLNNYEGDLVIYGPKGSKRKFNELVAPYLKFYAGNKFNIILKEVERGVILDEGEFYVLAEKMDHDIPTVAYSFIFRERKRLDKEKLKKLNLPNSPLIRKLVEGKTIKINQKKIDGKKLVYIEPQRKITIVMDTRINERIIKLAKGSDILIIESSYLDEEKEVAKEYAHMTAKQCAEVAKKAKVKKLFLTHLSQRYDMIPKLVLREAKQIFKNSTVAEDFDVVNL